MIEKRWEIALKLREAVKEDRNYSQHWVEGLDMLESRAKSPWVLLRLYEMKEEGKTLSEIISFFTDCILGAKS